jgi:hypothetical protein
VSEWLLWRGDVKHESEEPLVCYCELFKNAEAVEEEEEPAKQSAEWGGL